MDNQWELLNFMLLNPSSIMIFKYKNTWLFIGYVFFITLAAYFAKNVETDRLRDEELKKFQHVLYNKQERIATLFEEVKQQLEKKSTRQLLTFNSENFKNLYYDEGLILLLYENDTLKSWTDNLVPVSNLFSQSSLESRIVSMGNAWYVVEREVFDNRVLTGLILIKTMYPYENEFLTNQFQKDFKIPPSVDITLNRQDAGYDVYGRDNQYLFSMIHLEVIMRDSWLAYISGLLYLLGLFLLLIFVKRIFCIFVTNNGLYIAILITSIVFARFLMLTLSTPLVFNYLELFSPLLFAGSSWFPSLGDFLINALFIFFISYVFFNELNPVLMCRAKKVKKFLLAFGFFSVLILFFILVYNLLRSLIINSSILLEAYKIFDLTVYSFVGFLIFALLITSFLLLAGKIVKEIGNFLKAKQAILIFLVSLLLVIFALKLLGVTIDLNSVGFIVASISFFVFIRYKQERVKYSFIVLLALFSSVYTTIFIRVATSQKEMEVRKVMVENLANERDQVAEMLLEEINRNILKDTVVLNLSGKPFENESTIKKYLQEKYFNEYFRKYDIQLNACTAGFYLLIEDTKEELPCYVFFEEMVNSVGVEVPGTTFYFLNNLNGRISYLGVLKLHRDTLTNNGETTLFISLDSKLIEEGLGYPELLLDKRAAKFSFLSNYSYAKYFNKELITKGGDFDYPLINYFLPGKQGAFVFFNYGDFNHLIYKEDVNNTTIVSKPQLKLLDSLISFSYLFILYYFLLSIIFFVLTNPQNLYDSLHNFKTKIKLSMISILLLSLIMVGSGTVYYSIKQYELKLYENIREKTHSVLIELEQKLGAESSLNKEWEEYLQSLLVKFSNVFYSDINLYDLDGNLLASSRPEIFQKGLIGTKMNPDAFLKMVVNKWSNYIHTERMGGLKYYSAYIPFYNNNFKVLAYLNLPYFTKQSAIKKEIYTLVIAIINIYALLIIVTIALAVVFSNKITEPLRLIQEKLRKIGLHKKNEQIDFNSKDEIGSLIKEYNRMVLELDKSAQLLAKSEREMAWRDVSKQVAHEIKNPLTPMKLTVQHLQRTFKSHDKNENEQANKFFNTLIEQIDNLTNIATEFSNFAKMPKAKFERVNIVEKIKNSIQLFENKEGTKFKLTVEHKDDIWVFGDKEHLMRVFVNLIKNSLQAIPSNREGIINIHVTAGGGSVLIKIEDNGKGVPNNVKDRLFSPNFTTKSSGMGLGLTIVKNIIENIKGEIWFETVLDKGTTFFVKIPIISENETSSIE